MLTGVPSVVNGSSLPGAGRGMSRFILVANGLDRPRTATKNRARGRRERQRHDSCRRRVTDRTYRRLLSQIPDPHFKPQYPRTMNS
ncbi:hypothetical protein DMY01_11385 [Cutibacterium avidum]|nr:hypothetical protein DMY01_11385 [Cutibacterium avidum]